MGDEIRQLEDRILHLEALVGTIRDAVGCEARNVRDVSPEQHSREIMDRVRAKTAEARQS